MTLNLFQKEDAEDKFRGNKQMNFKQISKSGTEQVNQLCFHS